ncbi:MAG: AAA family ATPase [Candidatus Saganbacteria bacterium]|nr:AAA family ATPase [Candidatus Saganbacteria bacterium]
MKLIKAEIKNFRLLHDVSITFDKSATSIVGKNNSGKTSLSSIFSLFLSESAKEFPFEEFSLACQGSFIETYKQYESISEENKEEKISEIQEQIPKIQLILTIKYGKEDNWSNILRFFTSLEEGDEIKILCEYAPDSTEKFLRDLKVAMGEVPYSDIELLNKVKSHYLNHYKINLRPISESEETENISREDIKRLIQIKFINAQRVLDDSNSESRSRLSRIFHDLFKNENKNDNAVSEELLKAIETACCDIDGKLKDFFSPFVTHFAKFGFPGMGKEKVELKSQLQPEILFSKNIKLFYDQGGKSLPEKYNGLGYSNLICIVAHIVGFYNEIKDRKNNLNLIFIEEPEAHMHPQMQSVFVRNIVKFLEDVKLDAQVILTTHSPHILSASKLESIRYFTPIPEKFIAEIKDLMLFNEKLTENETKEFLQQYLTLGKCDLFFADKAIFFEGTVERILLPVFIDNIEKENSSCNLSEQYISSIEVGGAYISKFKELLEFLGLKTLIVTDIDSVKKDTSKEKVSYNKTEVKVGKELLTSNNTLKSWIPAKDKIDDLLGEDVVKDSSNGLIHVVYQKNASLESEPLKCGRSFEEAFIIDNKKYIFAEKKKLLSIENHLSLYSTEQAILDESFAIQEFIDRNNKKTEFAFDLLNVVKDDWQVPTYIKEGLLWLV